MHTQLAKRSLFHVASEAHTVQRQQANKLNLALEIPTSRKPIQEQNDLGHRRFGAHSLVALLLGKSGQCDCNPP